MPGMASIGLAMALSVAADAATGVRREHADVYAAGTDRLLYRETHWVLPGDAGRWVLYRCPDGKPFARKRVADGSATPDFALEDPRGGYAEGVRGGGASRLVYVRQGGEDRGRHVQVPADGVIDAGFDAAVRKHWASLMRGDAIRLQFLVPSRKRFYPVLVQRTGEANWQGVRAERLRMRLDSWFGFAVPDVLLLYSQADRRLLQFTGTGNVRNSGGDHPQVRIAFAPAPSLVTAGDVAAVRGAPLDGRCRF